MEAIKLAGLEPKAVFACFEKLCSIPHGSGNTKMISDYLVSFAKENGIHCVQDVLGNLLLFVDGTPGYEEHSPVILQGHMDMVCEKAMNCHIDMENEGLDVTHDGEWVFANGTTLGGDNGIAVAYIMALLTDKTIPHPPIEAILTIDEETGMGGAVGIDLSKLMGRTMLNLDSEEEGIFTVSCAGGIRGTIHLPVERRVVYGPCIKLTVEGLEGGHSGIEIHKNRGNAIKIMGQFLDRVQEMMPLCITKLQGGSKDNAIPRSCEVTLVAMGMHLERINDVAQKLQEEVRSQYDAPNALVRGDDVDALGGNALTTESTAKVIALLNAAPDGIQSWSQDIEGLVQTSLNLGIAKLKDELQLTFALRSSVNQEKEALIERLEELAKFYDGSLVRRGDYPVWEYVKDSRLRDTMIRVYQQMFDQEPKVVAIHAGLECGLLSKKLPGLDCVSIGPNMEDIHTCRERLNIASTERTWRFIKEILRQL